MGEGASITRHERIWFWGLLALAVLLRALQFDPFAMHHPDEVLQYIEPAYRLLTGEGIVTWEYRYGMRGWLLPVLLAGPMALGQAVGGTVLAGVVAARIAAALIGLIPVVAAWHLGRRLSPTHGIVAMAVMAVWYEQIVFSTHLLTETLATSLLLGAAALIGDREGRWRIVAGGVLLGFAIVFRFHYAVAAAVFVPLALGTDWKRWSWLILGAALVAVLSAVVDLVMGQWPFQWVWTNVRLNLIEGRAARFGVQPAWFYLTTMWDLWKWLSLPLLLLAIEAGKPYRPLLFAVVVNFAVHSMIAHKEYRFIELTTSALVLLAAIGSVNALRWVQEKRGRTPALASTVGLILAWAGPSAWLGSGRPLDRGFGERSSGPELVHAAGSNRAVCGLGAMEVEYWQLSRAYLGRPMPIVLLGNTARPFPRLKPPGRELASVNAVIAPAGSLPLLPGYAEVKCKGDEPFRRCLYLRPGPCLPNARAREREIQRVLLKYDH